MYFGTMTQLSVYLVSLALRRGRQLSVYLVSLALHRGRKVQNS